MRRAGRIPQCASLADGRRGKTYDLRPRILSLAMDGNTLRMRLSLTAEATGRPDEVLAGAGDAKRDGDYGARQAGVARRGRYTIDIGGRALKNRKIRVVAIVLLGILLVLYGAGEFFSAKPFSAPSLLSTPPTGLFSPPVPSSTQPHTPTPTWSSLVQTNMAEAPARWTAVAATNIARGAICMPGYELEVREAIVSMSTDEWTIFTCSPQPRKPKSGATPDTIDYRDRYTQVIRIDQTRIWTIMHRQFEWSNRPNAFLRPYRWSRDGNFVYLIWDYVPGPDGFYAPGFFFTDIALFRLNLNSGYFESILPYTEEGYAFSLSPDDRLLAYRNPDEFLRVRIRDFGDGTEKVKGLFGDYVLTGAFVWNPDGTSVYFASAMAGWQSGAAGVSIFELTADRMSMRTILFNDPRLFVPFPCHDDQGLHSWAGDHLLCIASLDEDSEIFLENYLLDVRTGAVIPAAALTLTPSKTSML